MSQSGKWINGLTPECSIVIPVYNKWEMTRNCLESLHRYKDEHDFEVIVMDNHSSDPTVTELFPLGTVLFGERFKAVVFRENRNFGPACNAGAKVATSPLLFFLNNDTLLTPGWFGPLRNALSEKNTGAVGPLLLYPNNTVQHLGAVMGTGGPMHLYQGFPASHPVVGIKRTFQFLTAAALMLPKKLFIHCGGFFPGYKNGFEDVDLCVRIRRQGLQLRYVPESRIYHLESQTPGRHKADKDNGLLLAERCGDAIFIDLHHHALRDGFDVFITDELSIGVRMSQEAETALAAMAERETTAEAWLHLTQENPFWIGGREVLAHTLERTGQQPEAIAFRMELADIEPLIGRYKDLLALAKFSNNGNWVDLVTKRLEKALRYRKDQQECRLILRTVRRHMHSGGDSFLEQAYSDKLRTMFS
jgi:GT2 family glycosyltransferase